MKEGRRDQSHSKGYHKKIIVDDPDAQVVIIAKPLIIPGHLRYTLELAWDGKSNTATIHDPKPMDRLAANEMVRKQLYDLRISCQESLDKGKPLNGTVQETQEYMDYLFNFDKNVLRELSIQFGAKTINEQKDAEKPMMAVIKNQDPNEKT
tara:strand:- start:2334 stop:2786 length:453 start_codon:yes stop_codon:yes gene_type:complete